MRRSQICGRKESEAARPVRHGMALPHRCKDRPAGTLYVKRVK